MKFKPRIPGLLGAFILLIIILFFANGLFNYVADRASARKSSASLVHQTKRVFSAQLDGLISPVSLMLKLTREQHAAGIIRFDDFRAANRVFIPFMKDIPQVSSINYGDASGNGYLILKNTDGWKNRIKHGNIANRVTWLDLDSEGLPHFQETLPDDYDPRKRPWYEQALSGDGIQWTKPYIFRTTKDLGMTASYRISNGKGMTFAAVGMDIILGDLSVFLSKAVGSTGASLYLLGDNGTVLASSDIDHMKNILRKRAQLPTVSDQGFGLLDNALRAYQHQKKEQEIVSFDFGGRSFFAGFEPLLLGRETIYLAMLVPESVFFDEFRKGILITLLASFVILLLGSVFFLYRYILPIRTVMHTVKNFGRGTYVPLPETRTDEIGALSSSFNTLAADLLKQKTSLIESEKQYRLLFENNPLPIYIFDLETFKILAVNRAAQGKYGYSAEEFTSMTIKDIRPQEDVPLLVDMIQNIQKSNDVQLLAPWRHQKKDGTVFEAEIAAQSILWKEKPARIVLINDITEKKQLEEMLRHSQKMESIGLLAGGVAHDFNNILSAIIGYSELLKTKIGDDEQPRQYVEQILAASLRAASLVKRLLVFSRKQELSQRPISINTLVKNVEKLLVKMISEDISIEIDLADSDILVMADSVQLEQVLINLATNARDAMPNGGKLVFKTGTTVRNKEASESPATQLLEYAVVAVSDTGTGMDKKTRGKIFEPFFTTKDVGKGTGLGLSIAFSIIAQHNGFIEVDSEPGKGTTFTIYLPLLKSAMPNLLESNEKSAAPVGGTETILLAEDDDALRPLTVDILKQSGYTVIEASDGDEAVKKYQDTKDRVHLLLLDVILPKKNGKQVFDEIREITPGIKAMFMSGYAADIVTQQGAVEQGAEFMTKPVTPDTLLKKVRQVLDREA